MLNFARYLRRLPGPFALLIAGWIPVIGFIRLIDPTRAILTSDTPQAQIRVIDLSYVWAFLCASLLWACVAYLFLQAVR